MGTKNTEVQVIVGEIKITYKRGQSGPKSLFAVTREDYNKLKEAIAAHKGTDPTDGLFHPSFIVQRYAPIHSKVAPANKCSLEPHKIDAIDFIPFPGRLWLVRR